MTAPEVVLVGRGRDRELGAIAALLRRTGIPVQQLSFERFAAEPIALDPAHGRLWLHERMLSLSAVWARHLPRPARAGPGWPATSVFAEESVVALLRQLAQVAPVWLPGPQPDLLWQLRTAAQVGVRVPATLVATEPDSAPRQWRRVVLKALDRHYAAEQSGQLAWFHPQIWDRRSTPPWPRPGLPAILQEYVAHEAEFRVYVVAGRTGAFEVRKCLPEDPWTAPERVKVRATAAPPAVTRAALLLASHFGLRYGAFDFLVDRGEPVFLEVNADGDWRWFEARAGVSTVTMHAARALAELHRAHHRSSRVEPMTFLSA